MPDSGGRLDVVATPIGNLEDLTPRARAALAHADLIAAEDTRRTGQLLAAIGSTRPMVSLHDYNEQARVTELLERLARGEVIALVSDAGTPLLSDPGFALVRAAAAAGILVRAVPGVSALTAALSIAGLPTDKFSFEGFLPARAAERRAQLRQLAGVTHTLIFFEAPHRIVATLEDLQSMFGPERRAVIARELTKVHETVYRGSVQQLLALAGSDANLARGEITLLVEGAAQSAGANHELLARAVELLARELPPARAAAIAAQLAGASRAEAYELALKLRGD